jgi:two-component system response regulator AtoC
VADCLESYLWPGNVRELRNAMERAALLSRGDLIVAEHLPARIRPGSHSAARAEAIDAGKLEEIEAQAVLVALRKNDFNRTATAKALGISRRAMIYKLQHLRELGHNVDAT